MQQDIERRRREREKYLVLRFYAKVLSLLSYIALVIGTLFAILVIPFAEEPMPVRISAAFTAVVMAGVYFVTLQSTAQAIFLLFDVARNTKTSREILEKANPAVAPTPPPPKPAPGD